MLTWYRLGKRRTLLGSVLKPRLPRVVGFVGAGTFKGTYRAVLTRKGVVIAQVNVKVINGR